jgi:hypothetical protein
MKRLPSVSFVSIITLVCALILFTPSPSHAGHALIPMTDEYVYLTQSRQEIIAAWGGDEEVLILTDEIAASREIPVIRYVALPTRPTVQPVPGEVLKRLDALLVRNAPRIDVIVNGRKTTKPADIGVECIAETALAPRDITVVRIESFEAFERSVTDIMKRAGIDDPVPQIERHRRIVGDCLSRGMHYFVFDVVAAGEKKAAANPVALRFRSNSLYVPLVVSSAASGVSAVDIFLLAPGLPGREAIPYYFSPLAYKIPDEIDFSKYPHLLKKYNPLTYPREHPVSFPLTMPDRVALSPLVAHAIPGWETKARFAAYRYRGELTGLSADISLSVEDFAEPDFGTAARAHERAEEFLASAPEGRYNILTAPDAADFSTGGSDPFTSGAAVDGDPSTPYVLPRDGRWTIDLAEEREIDGVEIVAAVTKPDIVPSKNRLCLYASDTGEFSGEEKRIDICVVRSFTSTMESDDPARYAERIVLTDRSFSARYLQITYPYSESISGIYLFEVMPWGKSED